MLNGTTKGLTSKLHIELINTHDQIGVTPQRLLSRPPPIGHRRPLLTLGRGHCQYRPRIGLVRRRRRPGPRLVEPHWPSPVDLRRDELHDKDDEGEGKRAPHDEVDEDDLARRQDHFVHVALRDDLLALPFDLQLGNGATFAEFPQPEIKDGFDGGVGGEDDGIVFRLGFGEHLERLLVERVMAEKASKLTAGHVQHISER